jgi:coenzyme F420-reducing hydrogenase beta subunit
MINVGEKEKINCDGCEACEQICPVDTCIIMKFDEEGFLYPNINNDICISCSKCVDHCHLENTPNLHERLDKPIVYAAINKNEVIRKKSTSGGIFTLIAENILSKGGIVFGVQLSEQQIVEHTKIDNISDLKKLRGSKYVQSTTNGTFSEVKELLRLNKEVLYSGVPCQIEGLYAYLNKEYSNLTTVSIVCHGVPSPKVFEMYTQYLSDKYKSKIKSILFRDKELGWKKSAFKVEFENKKEYKNIVGKDPFSNSFLTNLYLRPACHNCNAKSTSDIILGDFWGVDSKLPKWDDDKGTSLVLINTIKGQKRFLEIKNQCKYTEATFEHALERNPNLLYFSKPADGRDDFMKDLSYGKPMNYLIKKHMNKQIATLWNRIKRKIKRILINAK